MINFEEQNTESYFQSEIQIIGNLSPISKGSLRLLYKNEQTQNKNLNQSFEKSQQQSHPSTQNAIAQAYCNNKPETAVYYHNDLYFNDLTQHLDNPQQYLMEDQEEQLNEDQSQQQNQIQYQYSPQLNSQNDNLQFGFQNQFSNLIDAFDLNGQEILRNESFQNQEYYIGHQQTVQNSLSLNQAINPSLQSSLLMNNQQDQQSSTNYEDQTLLQDSSSVQQLQLEVKERQSTDIEEEELQHQFEDNGNLQEEGQIYNEELNYVQTINNKRFKKTNACKVCKKYYLELNGLFNHVKHKHNSKNVQAFAMMKARGLGRSRKTLPIGGIHAQDQFVQ